MSAEIKGGNLIITLPINKSPERSSTGRSLVVAGTKGFVQTEAKVDDKIVSVSVNAIIKP